MAVLFPQLQFFDNNGAPLSLGKVYTYITGTTTPKSTWTTAAESANHPNPVVLDDEGRAEIWLSTDSEYRITIKSATDATVQGPIDNVTGVGVQLSSFSQLASDLDVNGYDLVSTNNGDIELNPHGTGAINLSGPVAITGAISSTGGWTIGDVVGTPEAVHLGRLTVASNVISTTTLLTGYPRYKIIVRHGVAGSSLATTSTNVDIQLQLYVAGAYVTSNYTSHSNGFDTGGTAVKANSTTAAGFVIIPAEAAVSGGLGYLELSISDISGSIRYMAGLAQGSRSLAVSQVISGSVTPAGALTGFKIMASSGNLSGAQAICDVYGCPAG